MLSHDCVNIWNEPHRDKSNKMACAPSEDSDQPEHPPSLWALWLAKDPVLLHADSKDWSDWAHAQADLSLCWAHKSFCWFCHAQVQICLILRIAEPSHRSVSRTLWLSSTWQNQQSDCAPSEDSEHLGIRPAWSESSLCAQWVAKDPSFLNADSENCDQTGRMPRLIWVFAWRTAILLVFSCRGSFVLFYLALSSPHGASSLC